MKQITSLKDNEVFVFGSNANGNHAGGAARQAVESFGAIMGQAKGLQGQSYGIVTLDENMQKVSLDYIQDQLQELANFAEENEGKTFLLTLIGCGIAGFTTSEIRSVVRLVNFPDNVIVPDEFKVFYKGFDKDLRCRDFQYEVGKEYEKKEISICRRGFHAVENPLEIFDYYPMDSRFCEVEMGGYTQHESNDTKCCASRISIKAELKFADIIKIGVDWVIKKTRPSKIRKATTLNDNGGYSAKIGSSGDYAKIGSSGYSAKIGSSGDYAQIGSSGYSAKIGSSGYSAKIGSSGYYAQIGSSGYSAKIGSSGDYAKIGSSGDSAQIGSSGDYAKIGSSGYSAKIGSSGDSAQIGSSGDYAQIGSSGDSAKIKSEGKNAVICCAGNNCIAKGKKGSWITLSEWNIVNGEWTPVCVKTKRIDGERIKEDTYYKIVNGEFTEVEE